MAYFTVTVDDPDMASRHTVDVQAVDADAATIEAARRAILADRLGAGLVIPDGFTAPPPGPAWLTWRMPKEMREAQAAIPGLVAAVALYATVGG